MTGFNREIHVLTVNKEAKFSQLFRAIYGDGPCANCAMCTLREKGAQLWALDKEGKGRYTDIISVLRIEILLLLKYCGAVA